MGAVGDGLGLVPSEVWLELPAVVVPPSSSSPNANANCRTGPTTPLQLVLDPCANAQAREARC